MTSAGAIDEHLGDQILLPAALLAAGLLGPVGETRVQPSQVTEHLRTNARVIERFLPGVAIAISETGEVTVAPRR